MSPPGLSELVGAVHYSTILEEVERAATLTGGSGTLGKPAKAIEVEPVKSDEPTSFTARYWTLYVRPLVKLVSVSWSIVNARDEPS
jgi:hypothetical protein